MLDIPKFSPTFDFFKGYLHNSPVSMGVSLTGTPRTPVREKEKVSVQTPLERVWELGPLFGELWIAKNSC